MTVARVRRPFAAALLALGLAPGQASAEDRLLQEAVDFAGAIAFLGAGAPAFVVAAIRGGETAFAGFGEIARGSGVEPGLDTPMRIGSISKTFCGDVLASLAAEGALALTDPAAKHLPAEYLVPERDGRTLRLIDLVTQSSGLPRETPNQTGATPEDPFGGNTPAAQIAGLRGDPFLFAPGEGALYSNWGFDLLGLALAGAGGRAYAELLAERVLGPRGMTGATFALAEADEARAMQGHGFDGAPMPFAPTPVTIECAGGLYATAADMLKFMAWHLDRDDVADAEWRRMAQAGWLWRDGLSPVGGLDDGGPMGAMALGWVIVLPEGDRPLILQKSGGLQGMFTYLAIAPARGVGVFVAMNAFNVAGFPLMVETANALIGELAPR